MKNCGLPLILAGLRVVSDARNESRKQLNRVTHGRGGAGVVTAMSMPDQRTFYCMRPRGHIGDHHALVKRANKPVWLQWDGHGGPVTANGIVISGDES